MWRDFRSLSTVNVRLLIEVTAKGQTRVTQLTEDILIGYPEEVKRQAVSRAGRMPPFFREIYERFDDHIPSENALKSFFFQKGFTNEGVERVLKSFNATNSYVEIYGDSESYGTSPASSAQTTPVSVPQEENMMSAPVAAPPPQAAFAYSSGALDFSLSSSGLAVTGKATSRQAVTAFAEKLKALAALLPDEDEDAG